MGNCSGKHLGKADRIFQGRRGECEAFPGGLNELDVSCWIIRVYPSSSSGLGLGSAGPAHEGKFQINWGRYEGVGGLYGMVKDEMDWFSPEFGMMVESEGVPG